MSHVLHNPKAHAPAVYIPSWLSQVPSNELTPACKLVYGRLAQWSTSEGKAHRSINQLKEELGIPARTIEDCLKKLREKKLIESFVEKDGGHNHFRFYDHPWMHEQINKNLCYKSDITSPPTDFAPPPAKSAVPPAKSAVHKIKEIKENKKTTTTSKNPEPEKKGGGGNLSNQKKQMLDLKCQDDERSPELFLAHCEHHIEHNSAKKDDSVYKRTAMLIALLKVLLSQGEHFKSKGYIDVSDEKSKLAQESARQKEFEIAQEQQHWRKMQDMKEAKEKNKTSKIPRESGVVKKLSDLLKEYNQNSQ
jgi:hypothetical protein